MLESRLKTLCREGKENITHKPSTETGDMTKIKTSRFMSPDNPKGFLHKVWFIITLYWCRQGCDGQQHLTRTALPLAPMIRETTTRLSPTRSSQTTIKVGKGKTEVTRP